MDIKGMKSVKVSYENKKSGSSELRFLPMLIMDMYEEGYIFSCFIPRVMGPSGKILEADILFREAKDECIEYDFEYILSDNKKSGESIFSDYDKLINDYTSNDFTLLGAIPTRMGPSGKVLKLELIFSRRF